MEESHDREAFFGQYQACIEDNGLPPHIALAEMMVDLLEGKDPHALKYPEVAATMKEALNDNVPLNWLYADEEVKYVYKWARFKLTNEFIELAEETMKKYR